MRINRLLTLGFVLALLLGLLVPASAQGNKSVTILYPQEPDTLNPLYTNMFFVGITLDLYLAGAWTYDADLVPTPVLATEIPSVDNGGVSEDGTVITITLRDDIVWSDGEPITSEDFLFTYEMIIAEENIPTSRYPYAVEDGIITSIEAPDETTVVVTFAEPFAPWVTELFTFVLPEHVLRPVFEEEVSLDGAAWNRMPAVSSGPFVLDQWEVGSFMRFVPNENYYNGTPNLDVVVIQFITDDEALVSTLLNGQGDFATFISYSDVPSLQEAGLEVQTVASGYNEQWLLNVREGLGHPALQDVLVREAIALGVDRQAITDDLLLGLTYPASSYWEATPYESPNVEAPPYDPERAAELLDESGWVDSNGDGTRDKDGVELVLRYAASQRQIRQDVQAVVQQQLGELGIGIEIVVYPADQYFAGYGQGGPMALGEYDIATLSTTPSSFPDPNTRIFLCDEIPSDENPEGGNNRGICIEELDALLEQQARTTDTAARVALLQQIDELIASTYTWIGIWHDPDIWVVNSRVQNAAVNGITPFWNAVEWDVTE